METGKRGGDRKERGRQEEDGETGEKGRRKRGRTEGWGETGGTVGERVGDRIGTLRVATAT